MHDLWIFPTPRSSRWFARMDWFLNWQMSKGLAYGGMHLPDETFAVAVEHGLPLDVEPLAAPPLLVLPGARVPAKKCLVVEFGEGPLEAWFETWLAHARRLGVGDARVFLPARRSVAEAAAAWTRVGSPFPADFEADPEVNP